MLLNTAQIQKKINHAIAHHTYGQSPESLYEPISYIMQLGGKRLRPLLVIYAYSLFKDDYEQILTQAIGVEIFHNFTLMHDDIMDNADLRRNKPTVHKKWNNNIAILSGDVMLVKAYKILESLPENHQQKVFKAFNECAAGVCEGQQLDMDFSQKGNVSMEQYLDMIRLKTAILLGYSLELGAILSDTNQENIKHLRIFGEKIGLAFQIADDYLDVYGNADQFGKKVGGDIVENKKTFLSIKAIELANKTQKQSLNQLFTDKSIAETEKVKKVTEIYLQLNIAEHTQKAINEYYEEAMSHLKLVKCDIFRKGLLKKYVSELMQRQN